MQRLRGSDAFTIYSETPTSPFVTLKVLIYRPVDQNDQPDSSELAHYINRFIAVTGKARAGLGIMRVPLDLHHPVWVHCPDFSPSDHIHEATLPSPGSKAQLCEFISEILGKPLDYTRPLWEIWVVSGLEEGKIAIAIKLHHALADGKMVAEIIKRAGGRSTSVTALQTGDGIVEEPLPGKWRLVSDALLDLAKSFTVELPRFYQHLKEARRRAAAEVDPVDDIVEPFSAPFTILNTAEGGRERLFRYETISLSDFKTLSKKFDCTINTLVMGVCSEALKRYLQEVDTLPSESLISSMTIADRGGSSVERLLNSDIHNNNLAVAFVPLHQNIGDFAERLNAITHSARAAIDHARYKEGRRMDNYLDFMPSLAIRLMHSTMIRRSKNRKNPFCNLVIANVPGPREPVYTLGGRLEMEELLSVGNLMDAGHLNITVWSYLDNLSFSFMIRKGVLPQPDKLVGHLQDVLAELRAEHFGVST